MAKRIGVKPERVMAWEAAEDQPSIAQLRSLAELFRRTPAFFFLSNPPAPDFPRPPDFRGEAATDLMPSIRREMHKAMERRRALLELRGPPERTLRGLTVDLSNVEVAADTARLALGVTLEDQRATPDAGQALRLWIHAVEESGVLVFQMSRIPIGECRGLSIYEPEYPVIVLNGADPAEGRSFTLLHELGHLLQSSGSVCTLWANEHVERECNAFAGEVLMPAQAFLQSLGTQDAMLAVPTLAGRFRVSQEAAAARLRMLRCLDKAQVDEVRAQAARRAQEERERNREKAGGPPHFRTHLRNLGERYVTTVLDAYGTDQISLVDTAHLLDAKISTIERMERELQGRGAL